MAKTPAHNASLTEADFKAKGPFAGVSVDVVIPFYNEQGNIAHTHALMQRLERRFEIKNYLYVENGSKDATADELAALAKTDPKVKVVEVVENKGYGNGMKTGFAAATADYVMTNHADGQFDGYSYFITHLDALMGLEKGTAVVSTRYNRMSYDVFRTWVLQRLARVLLGAPLGDFNGQPKLFPRKHLGAKAVIEAMPDDFCLDLAVYLKLRQHRLVHFPIIQRGRHAGVSSWAGQWKRQLRFTLRFLKFMVATAWAARRHAGR